MFPGPTSQDPKPRAEPGVHPSYLLYKKGVKPGVLLPETWALFLLGNCSKTTLSSCTGLKSEIVDSLGLKSVPVLLMKCFADSLDLIINLVTAKCTKSKP
jgi:hypothetical protein